MFSPRRVWLIFRLDIWVSGGYFRRGVHKGLWLGMGRRGKVVIRRLWRRSYGCSRLYRSEGDLSSPGCLASIFHGGGWSGGRRAKGEGQKVGGRRAKARSRAKAAAASGEGKSRFIELAIEGAACSVVGWVRSPRQRHKGYQIFGPGGGAFVRGWVALAAARPENLVGLRPPTGRTDPSTCSKLCLGWRNGCGALPMRIWGWWMLM